MEVTLIIVLRLVVGLLSLILCIVALASSTWVTSGEWHEAGLWSGWTGDIPGAMHTVRAMVMLGMFILFGALCCAVYHMIRPKDNGKFIYIGGVLAFIAGLLQIIAFAVFAEHINERTWFNQWRSKLDLSFGWGFALDIITWLVAWGQAAFFIITQWRAG